MSRAALELERAVKEMRAKAAKEQGAKGRKANKEAEVTDNGNQLTSDSSSGMTDTDLSQQQGDATGGNDAAGAGNSEEGKKTTMAKGKKSGGAKKSAAPKAAKPAKAAKAAKGPKAPKGERKPREKKLASGKLKKVEPTGTTYLRLEFEEGSIMLTPTGNREQNRDIAVKALRALL